MKAKEDRYVSAPLKKNIYKNNNNGQNYTMANLKKVYEYCSIPTCLKSINNNNNNNNIGLY